MNTSLWGETMNYTRYLLAIGLLAFSVQARAFTVDDIYDDVTETIRKVRDVWNTVMGDVKDTAADLKRQLSSFNQRGDTAKETVEDAMDFLQARRQVFLDFLNGNPPTNTGRCGHDTPCMNFRLDLENFVLDIAALKSRFPQIEQHGLGDGEHLADVIHHLPPLVLFGFYEAFQRIPNWQDTPQNLADVYDEVGDPDAFSAEPLGASVVMVASDKSQTGGSVIAVPPKQSSFGSPENGIRKFCSKGKELNATGSNVRYNRVKMALTWVSNMLDGTSEFLDADYVVELIGEGGSVPVFIKGGMKTIGKVIESIFVSLDTYRANLDICRQIETDVAQGTILATYRTRDGVKTAYWVVKGVMTRASLSDVDQTAANKKLDEAGNRYAGVSSNGVVGSPDYIGAYADIVGAYRALFCSGASRQGTGSALGCPASS